MSGDRGKGHQRIHTLPDVIIPVLACYKISMRVHHVLRTEIHGQF